MYPVNPQIIHQVSVMGETHIIADRIIILIYNSGTNKYSLLSYIHYHFVFTMKCDNYYVSTIIW